MSQFTDKIKGQIESVNKQVDRVSCASRGLVMKISEETGRQLDDLVKEGETQLESGNDFTTQIKGSVKIEGDTKEIATMWRMAIIGLIKKAKLESKKIIEDLSSEVDKENAPKMVKPKAVKKATKTAQAA